MKKLIFLMVFILSGCTEWIWSSSSSGSGLCPQVRILRGNSYLTQFVNYRETFQISINGYEGYCYYDTALARHRAVIRPIFKIKRLSPSDETDVRFSYYTETVKGPPAYLGKKTYYLTVKIKADELETTYKAPAVNVFVPAEMLDDYDINLGLWLRPDEERYNQRTFDINYRYIEE